MDYLEKIAQALQISQSETGCITYRPYLEGIAVIDITLPQLAEECKHTEQSLIGYGLSKSDAELAALNLILCHIVR